MRPRVIFFLSSMAWILFAQQGFAAMTLASPEQDRRAKQAVPATGKALIYVYRLADGDSESAPRLSLNGRASGELAPLTYGMWAAGPGRLDIRAEANAKPLSIICQTGRVYFVQLTVNQGAVSLHQVTYGVGRNDLQQARLVLDPALAARAAAAPKPVAPPPPVAEPVKQAPAVRGTASRRPIIEKSDTEEQEDQAADGVTLIFKAGSFTLASKSQNLLGSTRSFSAANLAYGLEGEWRFRYGFAVGAEFFGHSQDYTTAGAPGNGSMNVMSGLINVKKYFRPTAVIQPYVGIGLGSTITDISEGSSGAAGFSGSSAGFAIQGMAGVAFRWRHAGIYTEFKYARAETEGTNALTGATETVDASGSGIFAGMNVHF